MNNMKLLSQNPKGISTVIGGFLLMLYWGSLYIPGNINPYLMSYFHQYDPSINDSDVFLILPCESVTMALVFPFASYLSKRIDGRLQMIIGCSIGITTAFISSFMTNFWAFFPLYALGFGIADGWKYFPNNKGLVSGIIICGFGFASFVFNQISTAIINPQSIKADDHGYFPPEVYQNVPNMIRILTGCWLGLAIIGIVLVFPYKENNRISKSDMYWQQLMKESFDTHTNDSIVENDINKTNQSPQFQVKQEVTFKQCILSQQFGLIYTMTCLSIFIGMFTVNTYKKFGMSHINDDSFLTLVGSVSSIFSGIRFCWTYLVDVRSFKLSYGIILAINVVFGFTLVAVSANKALFMIWVCMLLWAEGAHFALVPTICAKLFGQHAHLVFGFANSFAAISQIASSLMVKLVLNKVGYEAFYYLGSGLSLFSLCLLVFLFEEKKIC